MGTKPIDNCFCGTSYIYIISLISEITSSLSLFLSISLGMIYITSYNIMNCYSRNMFAGVTWFNRRSQVQAYLNGQFDPFCISVFRKRTCAMKSSKTLLGFSLFVIRYTRSDARLEHDRQTTPYAPCQSSFFILYLTHARKNALETKIYVCHVLGIVTGSVSSSGQCKSYLCTETITYPVLGLRSMCVFLGTRWGIIRS